MLTEIKNTLRRMRGAILGWGIGLFLYGLLMASFYSSLDSMDGYTELLQSFPEEMLAFFPSIYEFMTPAGYLETYFFAYMTIIVGIFAVSAGANLLVGDEEKGILDLVVSYPVSRTELFWGRLIGFMIAIGMILLISWLGWLIPSGSSGLGLSAVELLLPFLSLFAVLSIFGGLALMLSMLMPSARSAAALAGALLVVNFLLTGLANINPNLQPVYELSPLFFYQGGSAVNGIDWGNFLGLVSATLVLALIAWWRFQRRDIRVGGEGGWKLPKLVLFGGRG